MGRPHGAAEGVRREAETASGPARGSFLSRLALRGRKPCNGACVPPCAAGTTRDPSTCACVPNCNGEGSDCTENADCCEGLVCFNGTCTGDVGCTGATCATFEACSNMNSDCVCVHLEPS